MPALYPVDGHPLLSAEAATLDPEHLDAQAMIAERVLGLRNAELLEGDNADEAAGYVALQVSFQHRNAARGDVISESKGSQSFTYTNVGGRRIPVDAIAKAGVDALLERLHPLVSTTNAVVPVW